MTNFSVGSGSSSPIPGQRVSIEAKKAKATEAIRPLVEAFGAETIASCKSTATSPGGFGSGILGALCGMKITLPDSQAYTIQKGDNLNSIAKAQLGSKANGNEIEKFIDKVLDLNPDIIKNPHEIYRGDTIAVPRAPKEGAAKQVQKFLD